MTENAREQLTPRETVLSGTHRDLLEAARTGRRDEIVDSLRGINNQTDLTEEQRRTAQLEFRQGVLSDAAAFQFTFRRNDGSMIATTRELLDQGRSTTEIAQLTQRFVDPATLA